MESQKAKNRRRRRKNIWKIMPELFPNIMKHKFTDSRSSVNPKQNTQVHHSQATWKPNIKGKSWKNPEKNNSLRNNNIIDHWLLIRKKGIFKVLKFKKKNLSIHPATLTVSKLWKVKVDLQFPVLHVRNLVVTTPS